MTCRILAAPYHSDIFVDGVSQGDTSPVLLPNLWILDEGMPQCGRDPVVHKNHIEVRGRIL